MINQTDLKYFLELAKTQHVSRAADRLGVTQSALSHCLKRLEAATDATLFLRSKRGITLTSAGEKLLTEANELVALWEKTMAAVKEDVSEVSGKVRIGCHSAVAQYSLPDVLPELLKQNAKLEIELIHGLSRHMTEQVIASKIDVAVVVNPVQHPDLILKELYRDEVTLWKAKGCKNSDVLLIEPSLMQTQDILGKMAKRNLRFKRTVSSTSLEVLVQLLNSGAGSAILPTRVVKALATERIEKVSEAPVFNDRISIAYKREFAKTPRGKAVIHAFLPSK